MRDHFFLRVSSTLITTLLFIYALVLLVIFSTGNTGWPCYLMLTLFAGQILWHYQHLLKKRVREIIFDHGAWQILYHGRWHSADLIRCRSQLTGMLQLNFLLEDDRSAPIKVAIIIFRDALDDATFRRLAMHAFQGSDREIMGPVSP